MSDGKRPANRKPARGEKNYYEVIQPPKTLRRVIVPGRSSAIDVEAIDRASQALEQLSENFATWLKDDIDRLVNAARTTDENMSAEQLDTVYRSAHDLRANGHAYGQPRIAQLADSLCVVLEAAKVTDKLSPQLMERFIDAIIAVSRLDNPDDNPTADILVEALNAIASEKRQKADAIEALEKEEKERRAAQSS